MLLALLAALPLTAVAVAAAERPGGPQHYVYFERERHRIQERSFLDHRGVVGAQLKYTWRELEPARDVYRLQPVLDDLRFLEARGKRLFIQLQDVSFSEEVLVPDYLTADSSFGGGVARKWECPGDDESRARSDGWVARRWDPRVRARFQRLLDTLGRAVDGRIEGLNLPETSIDFCESGRFHPPGFSFAGYVDAVTSTMSAARAAFPRSVVIQYANFMPGEWLPWTDHGYLRAVYAHAERIGAGVGGPDLMPHRKGQRQHSYPLIAARRAGVLAGLAVQDGNLAERDPATGRPVTVAQLHAFARDTLRLDYLFWGTEEPYYSRDVLPYLDSLARSRAPTGPSRTRR